MKKSWCPHCDHTLQEVEDNVIMRRIFCDKCGRKSVYVVGNYWGARLLLFAIGGVLGIILMVLGLISFLVFRAM